MKKFTLYGTPTALARPRFSKLSRKVYDPQAYQKSKDIFQLQTQHSIHEDLFTKPLHLDVTFYMPIPLHKKRKNNLYHYCKPDLDNLVKWANDIGNGILYIDDSLICSINARKIYSDEPRTELIFTELELPDEKKQQE